jgi:hypothetical protein
VAPQIAPAQPVLVLVLVLVLLVLVLVLVLLSRSRSLSRLGFEPSRSGMQAW